MATIGEQIVQAMVDALNAPADKPAKTWRTRIDAFGSGELPACVMYAVSEDDQVRGGDVMLRTRTVRLEVMVAGEPPADQLVDPIYEYAIKTLHASEDLAQVIRALEEARVIWESEASYEDVCLAVIDFKVVYSTKRSDPTVRF